MVVMEAVASLMTFLQLSLDGSRMSTGEGCEVDMVLCNALPPDTSQTTKTLLADTRERTWTIALNKNVHLRSGSQSNEFHQSH